jgi:hypothetical protein
MKRVRGEDVEASTIQLAPDFTFVTRNAPSSVRTAASVGLQEHVTETVVKVLRSIRTSV